MGNYKEHLEKQVENRLIRNRYALAYNLINSLRAIFRNKKLTKETDKEKFTEWYAKVTKS